MSDTATPAAHTLSGGCHCGAVRFEAHGTVEGVIACNCSICSTKGLLLSFVPEADFRLLTGADRLNEYRFNTHAIAHMFCAVCGVEPFARATAPDGAAMVALNARCLDGVDLAALPQRFFDGRAR
ncbi:MAG TPA: GFA family protein [Xanthobacteraceae bacterium]|nr:GFA family protein [Xanthobacteraceae bacterium]